MTPKTPNTSSSVDDSRIMVYVMPGSQFSAKVIVALDSLKDDDGILVPYYLSFVSFDPKKRRSELPSGGRMVPEMKVPIDGEEPAIVVDSEKILHWLDDHKGTAFFPKDQPMASELSSRASSKRLAASVWYYNWVDAEGYRNSMRKSISKQMFPSWLSPVSGIVVDLFTKSTRNDFRKQVAKTLDIEVNDRILDDEPKMREALVEELRYFQSFLGKTADQKYLLTKDTPTAADFSVYVQVERLVGTTGDANVYCSMPDLKQETATDLGEFWKWHELMTKSHPIVFKGKRMPPK